MSHTDTAAPPERFNFARHLIALNAGRAGKTALIDDAGTLTYGQLADQVQRFSAALQALGLKREERVLLLMHDCSDWVVSFLGALHAGVVPVAVNTLLTADDYAYMLGHSRAQAVLTCDALLPLLRQALDRAPNEVRHVWVAGDEAAARATTGQGGEVGGGNQDRAFVPDGPDTDAAGTARVVVTTSSATATTWVPPGWTAALDPADNLILRRSA